MIYKRLERGGSLDSKSGLKDGGSCRVPKKFCSKLTDFAAVQLKCLAEAKTEAKCNVKGNQLIHPSTEAIVPLLERKRCLVSEAVC